LFGSFRTAKVESGGTWEALFSIVLLSRCLCGEFRSELLPLYGFEHNSCVRYNLPYRGDTFHSKKLIKFISGIPLCRPYPSIIQGMLYTFEVYDVIVSAWDSTGERKLHVYQCKEGSSMPKAFANEHLFAKSFLIRGAAVTTDQSVRKWFTPSKQHLESFCGVTSSQRSPTAWKTLQRSRERRIPALELTANSLIIK
jgi:hypothetical protein